jgi:hypothetical protein
LNQEEDADGNLLGKPKRNSFVTPIIVAVGKPNLWEKDVFPKYPHTYEVPLSFSRKMMNNVIVLRKPALENMALNKGAKYMACMKGVPNYYIMEVCTQYQVADGSIQPLT